MEVEGLMRCVIVNYGISAMILAAASISNPSYTPQNYQVFLLTVFIMVLHAILSSMPTKWLAQFNSAGSTFNFLALIVVIILIPAGTNRTERDLPRFTPSSEVWGTIYEGTAFPPGVSVLMSFIGVIWTMSGYDSPFHLAEECSNANLASPRAIVLTSATGGIFGWFLQLVVAYTVVDIGEVLDSDLGQPFAAYLMQDAEDDSCDSFAHDHCRLQHGPRMYDCSFEGYVCLRARRLLRAVEQVYTSCE
jgi:amino acid transporter